ncbi:SAM-dependent methyltransferase [Frankia sp. CNm7]|uniref:SAM-dependent methyltransferase n=2 Tax=Frankia nepalensis TaxID=1836974 RepID=A0A937UNG0_9ACTN|nr:SAM-dependent methyltransferase [Frankia nepalensis]MBL7514313.1 SAM-dependent methyltransferase [Frankia nepalensis]MBL7517862.1 SAM-dependent methyltransferase [Frankia nepalensis]MBL7628048.1 SAM-dependent methyltransferase [Frankia nepalensis]
MPGGAVEWEPAPVSLDVSVPQSARMYSCFLGGKDNFPSDREAAGKVFAVMPSVEIGARENRRFLHRAVRHVALAGVDQFVEVGTGFPLAPNVHEIVQAICPTALVVYVDNDRMVLSHARALLTSSPEGRTAYVEADLREPEKLLARLGRVPVDLSRPVALSLVGVLPFLADADDPAGVVRCLVGALAPGSFLVLSHGTGDFAPEETRQAVEVYRSSGIGLWVRSKAEIAGLVPAGMRLKEPGVVPVHRWRPEGDRPSGYRDAEVGVYGLVARKV